MKKDLNWKFIKECLAFRRQEKRLCSKGYRRCEPTWEIIRGDRRDEIILDTQISVCRKYVYTLIGKK